MQGSPPLVRDRFHVDVHLNKFLQDVSMALIRSVVEGSPVVCTFGVYVGDLELLYRWIQKLKHLLHVAFLASQEVVLIILPLFLPEVGPGLFLAPPRALRSGCVLSRLLTGF